MVRVGAAPTFTEQHPQILLFFFFPLLFILSSSAELGRLVSFPLKAGRDRGEAGRRGKVHINYTTALITLPSARGAVQEAE